ncbi:ATP-dependent DNA helicase DDX11-like [Gordionus sp. m RMFG-2023]|uniref:ATP-dependent DNA helicase DDX11-like n=1 Tax=Gordionus sp. m RMFG-2023 TaxID=3053472 RepID=UPI0031FCB4FD
MIFFEEESDDHILKYLATNADVNPTINEFLFPFQPYEIQKEFAAKLYETIDKRCIGLFESPTGTGKSMSIICGSLSWLIKHEKEKKEKLHAYKVDDFAATNAKEPLWLFEQSLKIQNENDLIIFQKDVENITNLDRRIFDSKIIRDYIMYPKYEKSSNKAQFFFEFFIIFISIILDTKFRPRSC